MGPALNKPAPPRAANPAPAAPSFSSWRRRMRNWSVMVGVGSSNPCLEYVPLSGAGHSGYPVKTTQATPYERRSIDDLAVKGNPLGECGGQGPGLANQVLSTYKPTEVGIRAERTVVAQHEVRALGHA